MNWFLIAIINPVAHALVNHLDKYLISRFTKGGSVGTLVLFSSLFSIVALPVIYVLNPGVLDALTFGKASLLAFNGALLVVAILFYLYALEGDEASYVAPLFQFIPVFGLVIGYFVLGETLTSSQFRAAGLIVLGGILLSLEFGQSRPKLKTKLLALMLGSSFFYAVNGVLFKYVAGDGGFLNSLFWDMVGKLVMGVLLLLCVKSFREQFIFLLKKNRAVVIGLNVIGEILATVGEVALVLAVLFAPVALVQSVGGLQPLFVFIFGVVLTLFFPHLGQEAVHRKALAQKLVGIIIISVGVYLL